MLLLDKPALVFKRHYCMNDRAWQTGFTRFELCGYVIGQPVPMIRFDVRARKSNDGLRTTGRNRAIRAELLPPWPYSAPPKAMTFKLARQWLNLLGVDFTQVEAEALRLGWHPRTVYEV